MPCQHVVVNRKTGEQKPCKVERVFKTVNGKDLCLTHSKLKCYQQQEESTTLDNIDFSQGQPKAVYSGSGSEDDGPVKVDNPLALAVTTTISAKKKEPPKKEKKDKDKEGYEWMDQGDLELDIPAAKGDDTDDIVTEAAFNCIDDDYKPEPEPEEEYEEPVESDVESVHGEHIPEMKKKRRREISINSVNLMANTLKQGYLGVSGVTEGMLIDKMGYKSTKGMTLALSKNQAIDETLLEIAEDNSDTMGEYFEDPYSRLFILTSITVAQVVSMNRMMDAQEEQNKRAEDINSNITVDIPDGFE